MKWRGWWRAFAAPEIPERTRLLERVLKLDMKMMAVVDEIFSLHFEEPLRPGMGVLRSLVSRAYQA